ncbi:MAG: sulfotransferase, partial [Thermodesulfovibrionia bacterium]|nr:sulfotransferase [Thermodesulfovibrionia bacterium]
MRNNQNRKNTGFPFFIIGLPRSGSTLLSRLLNETPDILSINDLYYLQTVFTENAAQEPLPPDKAARLADWILGLVSERSRADDSFVGQFSINETQIASIRGEVLELHEQSRFDWAQLMDKILSRVASHAGKKRWSDKTPQNFLHIKMLHNAFPNAKFLFLFRNPIDILASYKYARGEEHDRRRYHPVFYALYWRTAVKRYLSADSEMDCVDMVRYQDMIFRLHPTIEKLNRFLKTSIPVVDLTAVGDNTSFSDGNRLTITDTEKWICHRICRKEMKALDYSISSAAPHPADLPELLLVTLKFVVFQ